MFSKVRFHNCKPCGGSLAKELHEPPLHHHPAEAGQVEQNCQEYEIERNPLVVGVVHYGGSVHVPLLYSDISIVLEQQTSKQISIEIFSLTSPAEQAPLYFGGTFQLEYIQQ